MTLQDHNEARRGSEVWDVIQVNIVDFLRGACQLGDQFDAEHVTASASEKKQTNKQTKQKKNQPANPIPSQSQSHGSRFCRENPVTKATTRLTPGVELVVFCLFLPGTGAQRVRHSGGERVRGPRRPRPPPRRLPVGGHGKNESHVEHDLKKN